MLGGQRAGHTQLWCGFMAKAATAPRHHLTVLVVSQAASHPARQAAVDNRLCPMQWPHMQLRVSVIAVQEKQLALQHEMARPNMSLLHLKSGHPTLC